MAIEDILQKIDEETQEKIKELKEEYKQKIDKVKNDNNTLSDDLKKRLNIHLDKKVNEVRNRIITTSLLDERKRLLKVKTDSIKEIFDLLKENIKKLPPNDKKKIFKKFIVKNLESGTESLVIDKKNKWFNEKFLKELEKDLASKSIKKSELKFSKEDLPLIGDGVIIRSEFYEVNLTVDSIIQEEEDRLKTLIVKELFGE
ncbi:V-type ATP synthase subunit E [Candidatus Dependentiae bacterium]|nr:V-type ATP synthase subunit E [Candidatus Dependentiae bacterium]